MVTSLRWFGSTYHWTRRVGGADVRLDDVFTQDIFDFKTTLDLAADGQWARPRDAYCPQVPIRDQKPLQRQPARAVLAGALAEPA